MHNSELTKEHQKDLQNITLSKFRGKKRCQRCNSKAKLVKTDQSLMWICTEAEPFFYEDTKLWTLIQDKILPQFFGQEKCGFCSSDAKLVYGLKGVFWACSTSKAKPRYEDVLQTRIAMPNVMGEWIVSGCKWTRSSSSAVAEKFENELKNQILCNWSCDADERTKLDYEKEFVIVGKNNRLLTEEETSKLLEEWGFKSSDEE